MTAAALVLTAFYAALIVRYPKKYNEIVLRESLAFGIETTFLRAVIWTESKFNPNAVSSAGAVGLMQLMPATAEWCCEMLGSEYDENMLTDPEQNIRLGSYYLYYLLKQFDKNDAAAAYNAGQGNVKKWRAQGLTEYPFKETRDYVKRVLSAEKIYKMLKYK